MIRYCLENDILRFSTKWMNTSYLLFMFETRIASTELKRIVILTINTSRPNRNDFTNSIKRFLLDDYLLNIQNQSGDHYYFWLCIEIIRFSQYDVRYCDETLFFLSVKCPSEQDWHIFDWFK
jgi:hypothetical protein